MPVNSMSYPIVLRLVNGYVEASQPDLEIYRVRGKFDDLKKMDEIGAIVLDLYDEILKAIKTRKKLPEPSGPKKAIGTLEMWVGIQDASKRLGVSVSTVRRLCASGQLEFKVTQGGHRRIKLDQHSSYPLQSA